MNKSLKSYVLVIIQFGCIAGLLLTGPIIAREPFCMFLEIFGVVLVFWAVIAMRTSKISVFPNLKEGAVFIGKGPYRIIRHPMYLAVVLLAIALVLEKFTLLRAAMFVLLVLNLLIKIEFEESMLEKEFNEYDSYRKRTRKLLPFIY
jgi:protein-S-isoprenylcysteine O-methyltransferase Ste14